MDFVSILWSVFYTLEVIFTTFLEPNVAKMGTQIEANLYKTTENEHVWPRPFNIHREINMFGEEPNFNEWIYMVLFSLFFLGKMFFQITVPFGALRGVGYAQLFARIGWAHFCEWFRRASQIGHWSDFGGSGQHFGLETFWEWTCVLNKICCGGILLWWGFRGSHLTPMISMVPGTRLDVVIHQEPLVLQDFVGISSSPEKCRWMP